MIANTFSKINGFIIKLKLLTNYFRKHTENFAANQFLHIITGTVGISKLTNWIGENGNWVKNGEDTFYLIKSQLGEEVFELPEYAWHDRMPVPR